MKIPKKEDAIHKIWLTRILSLISDSPYLAQNLYFKGGTCASMLGFLDRFSIDLDFDYVGDNSEEGKEKTRKELEKVFAKLGLEIKDSSKNGIQYFLKYKNNLGDGERNTIKLESSFPIYKSSIYKIVKIPDIDKILTCQNKETMVAHKMVALMDRFEKSGHIAGRDIYDIHYFLSHGFGFNADVIKERTNLDIKTFLKKLISFIENNVTDKIIGEDLNPLLATDEFHRIRKLLKTETLQLLKNYVDNV